MRILTFDNTSGSGKLFFTINRNSPGAWLALADWLPYNETRQVDLTNDADWYAPTLRERKSRGGTSVIEAQFFYERKTGERAFTRTTKLDHIFTAEITPDHARVIHRLRMGPRRRLARPI
jgi:hypothetical protein